MTLAAAVQKLSDREKAERKVSGAELQKLVTDYAERLGWLWVHFRAAQTAKGWRVPVEGPLGAGWPDLILVLPSKFTNPNDGRYLIGRRVLAIEIKRQVNDSVTPDQQHVLSVLQAAGIEVAVVRPSDCRSPIETSVVGRLLR